MTRLVIALNFIVFAICNSVNLRLDVILGLNVLFYTDGFFWQPLTSMFVHANLIHVLMNTAVLYSFGTLFERYFGGRKFIFIYLVGGILTSILSFVFIYFSFINGGEFINTVGASGAISILLGMLVFLDKQSAKGLVLAILLMSFAPMLVGIKIAWYSHLIGFAIGYLLLRFRLV